MEGLANTSWEGGGGGKERIAPLAALPECGKQFGRRGREEGSVQEEA